VESLTTAAESSSVDSGNDNADDVDDDDDDDISPASSMTDDVYDSMSCDDASDVKTSSSAA